MERVGVNRELSDALVVNDTLMRYGCAKGLLAWPSAKRTGDRRSAMYEPVR